MARSGSRYIFLDIDGVICTPGKDGINSKGFNLEAVELLNKLGRELRAQLVITSSRCDEHEYQHDKGMSLLQELADNGVQVECAADWRIAETDVNTKRGQSIMKWASKHEVKPEQCIIFDDHDIRGLLNARWQRRFVKIDGDEGITQTNYEDAKYRFSREYNSITNRLAGWLGESKSDKGRG